MRDGGNRANHQAPQGPAAADEARFEVRQQLRSDSVGELFEARDRRGHRDVAVRRLRPELVRSRAARQRLAADVEAARRLRHHNVCEVRELVSLGDSLAVVTELVRGTSLREVLSRSGETAGLSVNEAFDIVGQLANGLDAIHKASTVHGHLTPADVVLTDNRAVILGLGIAGIALGDELTSGGSHEDLLLGDPAYMAPEHVTGGPPAGSQSPRTAIDVYALAAVAYELFYGRPPFGRAADDRLVVVLDRVVNEPPRCPLDEPTSLPKPARTALAHALARGLAKNPASRPATAGALREQIAGAIATTERTSRRASAALRPCLDTLLSSAPASGQHAAEQPRVLEWAELGQRALDRGDLDDADTHFNRVLGYANNSPHRWRERAVGLIGKADVSRQRAAWRDMLSCAERGLDVVDERREPVLAGRLLAASAWVRGYLLGDPGGLRAARRAVALLGGRGDCLPALADAYATLGACLEAYGDVDEQTAAHQRTADIGAQVGDERLAARGLLNLGEIRRALGDHAAAIASCQQVLGLLGPASADPLVGLAHNNLAQALVDAGRYEEGLEQAHRALAISDHHEGLLYQDEARVAVARARAAGGAPDDAELLLREAVDRGAKDGVPLLEGKARRALGSVLSMLGEDADALDELDRAERLLAGASATERAWVRVERARAYRRAGQVAGADRELADALRMLQGSGVICERATLARTDRA